MWAIRVLSGPQAGQIFALKSGSNILGRSPRCEIKILSPGISKEHVKIEVLADKFIISDLGSRNGTFINGVQTKTARIHPGDKIGLHEVLCEIVAQSQAQPASYGTLAYNYYPQAQVSNQLDPQPDESPQRSFSFAKEYVEKVVLPGVYQLAEAMEFKWVLALFMATFILLVTSLSTIPLIRILRDSVEEQSQQHALTIAASLARVNEGAIREGVYTAINMGTAQRVGVNRAMVIQAIDGKIIAPSSMAETFVDIPFAHEARKRTHESVAQVNPTTVVALYPVDAYNAETGSRGIMAYALVEYDMSSLAVDNRKTLSLFISTLFIALILGTLLFFFLYKLVEYPIKQLNIQLDSALKDGTNSLRTDFQFEPLNKLYANVNSALTKIQFGSEGGASATIEHDRRMEMANLVELMGFASLAISAYDKTISAINPAFEELVGLSSDSLLNKPVELIADQALKLSLKDLIDRVEKMPEQMASNQIEFGGLNHDIVAQAIYGSAQVAYYLIVVLPKEGG